MRYGTVVAWVALMPLLALVVVLGVYSRGPEMAERDGAPDTAGAMAGHDMHAMGDSPASTMSGMDHSAMAAGAPASDGIAGMDHAAMEDQPVAPPASGAVTGMDHASMPGMDPIAGPAGATPPVTGAMDHGTMAATDPGSTGAAATDHAAMPGMGGAAAANATPDEKLRALAAMLLYDPVVRARVRTDPALRALWDEASVRGLLGATPE